MRQHEMGAASATGMVILTYRGTCWVRVTQCWKQQARRVDTIPHALKGIARNEAKWARQVVGAKTCFGPGAFGHSWSEASELVYGLSVYLRGLRCGFVMPHFWSSGIDNLGSPNLP